MSKKNYFRYTFWAGFIVWFVGSWIGGWNAVAESNLEGYTDSIGAVFMLYGGLGDILKGLKIHKTYEGDTFNAENFKYIDKRPNAESSVQFTTKSEL